MVRFREILLCACALAAANFVYQYFTPEQAWAVAVERSWYQASALLIFWVGNHASIEWR